MKAQNFLLVLLCLVALCCKKTEVTHTEKKQEPWTVEVISINKLNVNKVAVKLTITTDSSFLYDDYGVLYSKSSIASFSQPDVHVSSKGALKGQLIASAICTLDSLEGNTVYYFKAFVKKGNNTYLSTEKMFSVGGLKILAAGPARESFYAERGEYMSLQLNYNDSLASVIETKLTIGGVPVPIQTERDQFIQFIVPETLTAGKKSIRIERNGLVLSLTDTLEILRGRYSVLSDGPFTYRSLFGYAQIGNTGYLIGGSEYAFSGPNGWHKEMLKYDLTSGQWKTDGAPFPTDFFVDGLSFTVNNKIYAFPGRDNLAGFNSNYGFGSNRMWEFNPATNSWVAKAFFPGAARIRSSGFVLNGKIYILGGFFQSTFFDLWEYDPASDNWTKKADFPGAAIIYPSIFASGNQAMVFGGFNVSDFVSGEFWQYDALKNEWLELPVSADVKKRFRSQCFTIGDKGYMLGGCDYIVTGLGYAVTPVEDSWELDLTTKQWTRIASNHKQIPMPQYFDYFYLQAAPFIKNNSAIIYDKGKMLEFIPD